MPTTKSKRTRSTNTGTPEDRTRSVANSRYRTRADARTLSSGKSHRGGSVKERTPGDAFPGWGEWTNSGIRKGSRTRQVSRLDAVSTLRFALLIMVVAAGFTLYVGHVQDMQNLLADLQRAERENLRLNLKYNRLKGAFDRETGPAIIYERARAMGLEEGIEFGPMIVVE